MFLGEFKDSLTVLDVYSGDVLRGRKDNVERNKQDTSPGN